MSDKKPADISEAKAPDTSAPKAEKAAEPKSAPTIPGTVIFTSTYKELNVAIQAGGQTIRPRFAESDTILIWDVPKQIAADFANHSHVKSGKIKKAL